MDFHVWKLALQGASSLAENGPGGSVELMRIVESITGIPRSEWVQAHHRSRLTGSLAPFRQLMKDPRVPKAANFRYEFGGWRGRGRQPHSANGIMANGFTLSVQTSRGRVTIRWSVKALVQKDHMRAVPTTIRMQVGLRAWEAGGVQRVAQNEWIIAGPKQPAASSSRPQNMDTSMNPAMMPTISPPATHRA